MKTSDEFVKKLQQKNSGVVVWPIEACNIFSRLELSTSCEKKGGKEKKITALQLLCVCVLYYRDQKKAPFLQKSRGESYSSYSSCSISTILVLYALNWYTVYTESFCVTRKTVLGEKNVLVIDNH